MEARRALSHGHLPSWHDFPASWHAVQEYRGGALGDNADATGALFEAHDLAFLWDERSQKKGRAAVIVSSPYPVEIPSYRWVGIELADISWWVQLAHTAGCMQRHAGRVRARASWLAAVHTTATHARAGHLGSHLPSHT